MKLNHINLVVADVAATIQLFEKHFNFRCTETKGNGIVAILKAPDGFTLVIMKPKNMEFEYPQAFHIGFMQDNIQQVSAIYLKLKEAGINVGEEPKNIRDSFGFYFTFDKIMIEVGYYL